jgi:hypothetical protein
MSLLDLLDTSLLRSRSLGLRCSKKTSASSRSRIAFHFVTISSIFDNSVSRLAGLSPKSPADMEYSGIRIVSDTVHIIRSV